MTLKYIKFDDEDLGVVETVRQMYGCDSFSHAVRPAAHMVAPSRRVTFPIPPSPKCSNTQRTLFSTEGIIQLPETSNVDALDALLNTVAHSYRFAWHDIDGARGQDQRWERKARRIRGANKSSKRE